VRIAFSDAKNIFEKKEGSNLSADRYKLLLVAEGRASWH
jgi:hypothetical protein